MNYTVPQSIVEIEQRLAPLNDFWAHWGFEPWQQGPLVGVSRLQRFVKKGMFGPVAEYRAMDYIVWRSGSEEERETLWKSLAPMANTMTQRFLFIVPNPWTKRRIRSFFIGLKGYAEFHAYLPTVNGGIGTKRITDLTQLVEMGIRLGASDQPESAT